MASQFDAYLKKNPQEREKPPDLVLEELYQTSGVDEPFDAWAEKALRDPDNVLSARPPRLPKSAQGERRVPPAIQGMAGSLTSGAGNTLQTLQQVPGWLNIPKGNPLDIQVPEPFTSPGAMGAWLKKNAPKADVRNPKEYYEALGGSVIGAAPPAIAEWVYGGVPYYMLKGAHEAQEIAKEKGPGRTTTGIEVPQVVRDAADYYEVQLPKKFGESLVKKITPESWHKMPEDGSATPWEVGRDMFVEGGARAYMGWVMSALKPQRWLQQSFHFTGAQGLADTAVGKSYEEQAVNFALSFALTAVVGKVSAQAEYNLTIARRLAESGDGKGAMRHLDEALREPEVAAVIARAARTHDLSARPHREQMEINHKIVEVEKQTKELETAIADARKKLDDPKIDMAERPKIEQELRTLEDQQAALVEKGLDLYWERDPSFKIPEYQPRGPKSPVEATDRLGRWEGMETAEATLAATIARKQERDARIAKFGEEGELLFKGVSSADRLAMISAVMRGKMEEIPEQFRPFFAQIKKMNDEAYKGERASEIEYEYRENYWPLMWEEKNQRDANRPSRGVGRGQFTKEKTFDDVMEGIEYGYRLRNDNPAVLAIWRLEASNLARAKVDGMRWFVEDGLAVPKGSMPWEVRPEDAGGNWRPERPDVFQNWREIKVGGKEYYINPDAEKYYRRAFHMDSLALTDFLNLDKHGLTYRGVRGLGQAWMTMRNATIPMKLSFSGFHGKHVVDILMANQANPVVTSALNKHISFDDFIKGIKDANITGSYAYGSRLRENFAKPYESLSPIEQVEKDIMISGGFNPAQPDVYRLRAEQAYRRSVNDFLPRYYEELQNGGSDKMAAALGISKEYARQIGLEFGRMIEKIQEPLFGDWIPAVKASAYLNESKQLLTTKPELLLGTPEANNAMRIALTKVRKNIDDRFGEMQYEKLFWPNSLKRAAIGSFLSVGWNFGFLRQYGGAIFDAAGVDVRGLSGRRIGEQRGEQAPSLSGEIEGMKFGDGKTGQKDLDEVLTPQMRQEVTSRMAYVGLYSGLAILQGGAMTMINAGRIEGGKDLLYPVQADGTRANTPFLTRVMGELYYHGKNEGIFGGLERMTANKLNAPASGIWYGLKNRDFFERQIMDPQADPFTKLKQFAEFYIPHVALPISYESSIGRDPSMTPGKVGLGLWGFNSPAPGYIENTPLESEILYLFKQQHAPNVTPYAERKRREVWFEVGKSFRKAKESNNPADWLKYEEAKKKYTEDYKAYTNRGAILTQAEKRWSGPRQSYAFGQLDRVTQDRLLEKMEKKDRDLYGPWAKADVAQKWGYGSGDRENVRPGAPNSGKAIPGTKPGYNMKDLNGAPPAGGADNVPDWMKKVLGGKDGQTD